MKHIILTLILFVFCATLFPQEVVLTGNQHSVIQYQLQQTIKPFKGIDALMVSFVVPRDYTSPTYVQKVSKVKFDFKPAPGDQEQETDKYGNVVKKFYWDKPAGDISAIVALQAENRVQLLPLNSKAGFPPQNLPADAKLLLKATSQVQADNGAIRKKANELTANSQSEYQAVQAILHFVVDQLHYVLVPEQYDALYAFKNGKGNCQNYSHLAAALLRAVGIPARIVNGITLKKAYDVTIGSAEYSFEMAQGRHSWIEVYFPDLGWVPFDPQQTEFFISNRYLRIEVGLDNEETVQDGLVRWSQSSGNADLVPGLEEAIESDFISDEFSFHSEKKIPGPRNLLLTPRLIAAQPIAAVVRPEEPKPAPQPTPHPTPKPQPQPKPIEPVEPQPAPEIQPQPTPPTEPIPEKPKSPEIDYTKLTYNIPVEIGNLDFPRNFDFLYARLMGSKASAKKKELRRNFMVETAEYVTGPRRFIQTFILDKPVLLKKIGLAMHNFGGNGLIWLELIEDNNGQPGNTAATSRKYATNRIRTPKGYNWIDFDFSAEGLLLTPGRYWITLKYSGAPIMNWFYTYGKPVGPVDGTRSFTGSGWDRILNYEFNYRVVGKTAKL